MDQVVTADTKDTVSCDPVMDQEKFDQIWSGSKTDSCNFPQRC